jgi:GNAT superfamily N-acetyltransferase
MFLEVRYCKPADFDKILILLQQLWPDQALDKITLQEIYCRALNNDLQKLIVCVGNGHIVGFCSLTIKNNFWQAGRLANVDELVVDVNHRGSGIGTKLMERITEIAMEHNCVRIELDSSFHREEAHQFYLNIGFKARAYLFTKPLRPLL